MLSASKVLTSCNISEIDTYNYTLYKNFVPYLEIDWLKYLNEWRT